MKHLDLFSGIGGFALAAQRVWGADYHPLAFCEIDQYCQKVLAKHWPNVPIIDDVCKIKGKNYGSVDVISGGFPCQDLSSNGKQAGITGDRSGLWGELCRIIGEIRPNHAIMENVTNLLAGERGAWFGTFLRDLAQIGYDAQWHCISASSIGCCHQRDRVFILAHPASHGWDEVKLYNTIASSHKRISGQYSSASNQEARRLSKADICSENDGIPNWMDQLRGYGNSIVPQIAEIIFAAIKENKICPAIE